MTNRDDFPPCDEPHDWVIFVSGITTAEACDLGKLLGSNGYTGTFHDGPLAHHMRDYKRLKSDFKDLVKQMKGGEADGRETLHQA